MFENQHRIKHSLLLITVLLLKLCGVYLLLMFIFGGDISPMKIFGPSYYYKNYVFRGVDTLHMIDRINDLKSNNPDLIAWSKSTDGTIYNPDGRRGNFNNYVSYFKLPVRDTIAYVQIYVENQKGESCKLIFYTYTMAGDIYRGWTFNSPERDDVIKSFEKEVIEKLKSR